MTSTTHICCDHVGAFAIFHDLYYDSDSACTIPRTRQTSLLIYPHLYALQRPQHNLYQFMRSTNCMQAGNSLCLAPSTALPRPPTTPIPSYAQYAQYAHPALTHILHAYASIHVFQPRFIDMYPLFALTLSRLCGCASFSFMDFFPSSLSSFVSLCHVCLLPFHPLSPFLLVYSSVSLCSSLSLSVCSMHIVSFSICNSTLFLSSVSDDLFCCVYILGFYLLCPFLCYFTPVPYASPSLRTTPLHRRPTSTRPCCPPHREAKG
ncbi:hypothetical protein FA15DRAFT_57574 [Coprinopsis marcescibilis]|uniref:Uncharacterized protein n=1 Tax=Coprinopsis marcescibilis TaxID=230819 RepID=A0A5C3KN83_COPMA|nr:hypothetical protein FA15DRAFT_57574 [Coprinopsis marcescibilis]